MQLRSIPVRPAEGVNLVIGQAHFIRTAEDLAEAVATSVPRAQFGLAFNEAQSRPGGYPAVYVPRFSSDEMVERLRL
jgi:adenosine/AMP kinase